MAVRQLALLLSQPLFTGCSIETSFTFHVELDGSGEEKVVPTVRDTSIPMDSIKRHVILDA